MEQEAQGAFLLQDDKGNHYAIPVDAMEQFKVSPEDLEQGEVDRNQSVVGHGSTGYLWQPVNPIGGSLANYKPPTRRGTYTPPTPG